MKKRKYLRRLILVTLLGVICPAILAFHAFQRYAWSGWEKANEDFYGNALSTYVSLLDKRIQEMENFAARLSVLSKSPESVMRNDFQSLDPYQIYLLTQELSSSYYQSSASEWGIYFYSGNKIVTDQYSYTLDNFLYKYTGDAAYTAGSAGFFSEDQYSLGRTLFNTTASENDRHFLVGICTRVGLNNQKALVFFVLSDADVANSLSIVGGEGIAYYLLDSEADQLLLTWGDVPEDQNAVEVLGQGQWRRTLGINQKVRYDLRSKYPELSIVAYVFENSMQDSVIKLVSRMWLLLSGIFLALLLVGVIAVYISYKPVHELTEDLGYSGGSEFEMIRNQMNSHISKISEQQMLILDLLMNNLIYGVPLSQEEFTRLGIGPDTRYYCVFLIDGYSFVNEEMEQLTSQLEDVCHGRIFATDWYEEDLNVLICFLKERDTVPLEKKLTLWLQENGSAGGQLYTGKIYDKIEDIQLSFRSCIEQRKKKKQKKQTETDAPTLKQTKQAEMLQDILRYLEENYRDPNISQVQLADHFQISNYTLSRLFKNELGVGFAEYLSAKRLEHAKELLLTTTEPIREIAFKAGFSNENYFSRTFKLYTGMSPSAFRKQ